MSEQHHAGGKSRLPLLEGVSGSARFAGERSEHRLWIVRQWAPGTPPCALFIGLNPSTARADEDDLTLRKDQGFTQRLGLSRLVKMNFASYCCTDPTRLPAGVQLSHPENVILMLRFAKQAAKVMIVAGNPPTDEFAAKMKLILRTLKNEGIPMFCYGKTKDGWPKHTSRLAYDTPLEEYVL